MSRDYVWGEKVASHYTVGLVAKGKADRVAVDAEDALIAALWVKASAQTPPSPMCAGRTAAATPATRPIASPLTAADLTRIRAPSTAKAPRLNRKSLFRKRNCS